jgi:hypothetical protein
MTEPAPLPLSVDLMPRNRVRIDGPQLDPDEAIAFALSSIPYNWSGKALSKKSLPVRLVLDVLYRCGYEIVRR